MHEVSARVQMKCGGWTKVGTVVGLPDAWHNGKTRVLWDYYVEFGDPMRHKLGRRTWVSTRRLQAAEKS